MAQTQNFIPQYGPDGLMSYLGGIAYAVLGRPNPKFNLWNYSQNWNPQTPTIQLLDVSRGQLLHLAQTVPHLNVVVSKGAEMFSNVAFKHIDRNGNEIDPRNSEVMRVIRKPNPMQKKGAFCYEFFINWAVYNNNFIYKNTPLPGKASVPKMMWNLPSGLIQFKRTGKLYDQHELEGIIEYFQLIYNQTRKYLPSEIIMMSEGIVEDGLIARSRIESIQIPLSNIMAALKSQNVIVTERGLIGFISADGSRGDGDGPLPPDADERERMEKDYKNRYDVDGSQGHVSFTHNAIKWVPMTFDVGQLQLLEGLEDGFGIICGQIGIDRDVFPSVKGATWENKDKGERMTYQNTMQPLANKLADEIADAFSLHDKGESLIACYDHLPVMKEDELKRAQAQKIETERHSILFKDDIINGEAYADMEGVEFSGEGQIKHPPTSLSLNNGSQTQQG